MVVMTTSTMCAMNLAVIERWAWWYFVCGKCREQVVIAPEQRVDDSNNRAAHAAYDFLASSVDTASRIETALLWHESLIEQFPLGVHLDGVERNQVQQLFRYGVASFRQVFVVETHTCLHFLWTPAEVRLERGGTVKVADSANGRQKRRGLDDADGKRAHDLAFTRCCQDAFDFGIKFADVFLEQLQFFDQLLLFKRERRHTCGIFGADGRGSRFLKREKSIERWASAFDAHGFKFGRRGTCQRVWRGEGFAKSQCGIAVRVLEECQQFGKEFIGDSPKFIFALRGLVDQLIPMTHKAAKLLDRVAGWHNRANVLKLIGDLDMVLKLVIERVGECQRITHVGFLAIGSLSDMGEVDPDAMLLQVLDQRIAVMSSMLHQHDARGEWTKGTKPSRKLFKACTRLLKSQGRAFRKVLMLVEQVGR